MEKFTPGPWKLSRSTLKNHEHFAISANRLSGETNDVICVIEGVNLQPSMEDLANATLVAVAPELFAIAKELADWENDPDRYDGDLADLAQKAKEILAIDTLH